MESFVCLQDEEYMSHKPLFHCSAWNGDFARIEALLAQGIDVGEEVKYKFIRRFICRWRKEEAVTALAIAVDRGHKKVVHAIANHRENYMVKVILL